MSYQVLARKWRPRSFGEMVGQEHVLRAMINALDNNRLHHAYLFTGTRGVGKTTIARILAKSLNCEKGITSSPCGQCSACLEIDQGRFVDLIEVDAASRTKVEDTRELLENVQYAPTRGRYKVYLIDEVHMLSGHSFNALLKTLEEPPQHVKFLLATTDPQKLPVTILSRCLQFSLKSMPPERIVGHLRNVLEAESVAFDDAALWSLARAAQGSMRDAMSLTDQAIAFGAGEIRQADVAAMLGTIDRDWVWRLMEPMIARDVPAVFSALASLAEHSPDYAGVLADIIMVLHRVTAAQLYPDAVDNSEGDAAQVSGLASRMTPEDVQLFYQMALLGRRDLPLSPDARTGFEMVVMRMLMFRPVPDGGNRQSGKAQDGAGSARPPVSRPGPAAPAAPVASRDNIVAMPERRREVDSVPVVVPRTPSSAALAVTPPAVDSPAVVQQVEVVQPAPVIPPATVTTEDPWCTLVEQLSLTGPALNFARNCALESQSEALWVFNLSPSHQMLMQPQHVERLEEQLARVLDRAIRVRVDVRDASRESPAGRSQRIKREAAARAEAIFRNDPFVVALQGEFGGVIETHSIKPLQ